MATADPRLAYLHRKVRELDRAGQELFLERQGIRMYDAGQDEITAGWAALDEVRARLARQSRETR